jgi:tetratricopeptide (TPR) repeat protein
MEVLSFVERRSGQFKQAVEHMMVALRLAPRDAKIAWEIANTYLLLREYRLAEEYCRIALRIEPSQGDAQILLVRNRWLWYGSSDSTRDIVDTALNKYSGVIIEPFLQLIYDQKYNEAIEWCNNLTNHGTYQGSWFYSADCLRAWAFELKGEEDSAKVCFQRAISELENRPIPPEPQARYYSELGIMYAYLGKTEEAILYARQAVELSPVSADAMRGPNRLRDLAMVLSVAGRHDEAMILVDSLLRIPGQLSVPLLRLDKRWASLYDDSRFEAIADKYRTRHGL